MKAFFCKVILFLFVINLARGQGVSADELFAQARTSAFINKSYTQAIRLSKQALAINPEYTEVAVFLGRVYTWNGQKDSAMVILRNVLSKDSQNEDASLALGNLYYWNSQNNDALEVINNSLRIHQNSEELKFLKANVLVNMRHWKEADSLVNNLLVIKTKNPQVRALANRIRENLTQNMVNVSYGFINFDKQFPNPWHLFSIDYGLRTNIGLFFGRLNYANRFNKDGLQLELDAYPQISKNIQAYLSGGYATQFGVFPKYRAGASLYFTMPKGFETEVGFRYLNFGNSTWIYTASLGKYYRKFWFNFRTYLSPESSKISSSYAFLTRYYYGGVDDYFSLRLGTGLSPDNSQNIALIGKNDYRLVSNNVALGVRKAIRGTNVLLLNGGLNLQEYKLQTIDRQIEIGLGYIKRF
ncbi:MAG: YaiO family outer membrane beta-barrel protein [Emticicia sp.]|uniref:YaiO family outer membrane beta-barrel protein n=1 Tax=Emticicia sp. TaxID=1930953 RepID=UPI003BA6F7D2